MKKYWMIAAVLIIAVSISACGSKPAKTDAAVLQEGAFTIPDFASKDFQGNEINNKFFAGNKLTVVNIWTTT